MPEPDSVAKLYMSVVEAPACGALPRGRDLCREEAQGSAFPRPAALRAALTRTGCGVSLWYMRLCLPTRLAADLPSPSDIGSRPAVSDRSRLPIELTIARCSDDSTSVNACTWTQRGALSTGTWLSLCKRHTLLGLDLDKEVLLRLSSSGYPRCVSDANCRQAC